MEGPDPMDGAAGAEVVSREQVLRALRHLTAGLATDDAGVRWLLGQLDVFYGEITEEAAEAVRRELAEAGARAVIAELAALPQATPEAVQADSPEPALDTLGARQGVPPGSDVLSKRSKRNAGHPEEGLASPQESPAGESRECRLCGVSFEVNPRHRNAHAFCTARCRVRSYRRNADLPTEGTGPGFGGCGAVRGVLRG